jgi:hypothetical protein
VDWGCIVRWLESLMVNWKSSYCFPVRFRCPSVQNVCVDELHCQITIVKQEKNKDIESMCNKVINHVRHEIKLYKEVGS